MFEFDLAGTDRRLLINGDEEFPPGAVGVARVAVGGDSDERGALAMGLMKDSTLRLQLPGSDLEGEDLFDLELRFFRGSSPLVLIHGSGALPAESVLILLERIERTLRSADLNSGRYLNLGKEAQRLVLVPLRRRIAEVEQSVRDALDDERFTSSDYEALQRYPARLAKVEQLARTLYSSKPEYQSFEPKGGFPRISAVPDVDWFFKWAAEVEQEARDSTARMSGLIASQQIVLTQRQAGEAARFQRVLTVVGAAVLVPGLVAAIFGANVGFRGRDSTHDFWAMLLLMLGGGLVSYAVIKATEVGLPEGLRQKRQLRWILDLSGGARLAIASVGGGLLVVFGVSLLVVGS
ncbi:MAG TPA: hypothetical protein VHS74_16335 [Solirubrobacterales bacterium]|nr:hypothetical protein [Solirubrobacterales bacterium]